jgi:DNA-binding protein HU-beta
VTKNDLINVVAKKAKLTNKAARDAVQAVFDTVTENLKKGEKIVVTGFGTFAVRKRQSREGRNPQTGEKIMIPEMRSPTFTAGKTLKRDVR